MAKTPQFYDSEETEYPTFDNWIDKIIRATSNGPHKSPFTMAMMDEINGLIKRWERIVYLGGFQEMNNAVRFRGFSMKTDGAEMLTYTMAGRVMVTINASDASAITFICDEDTGYPRAGLHTISGDIDAITFAVGSVCDAWKRGDRPTKNKSVSLG